MPLNIVNTTQECECSLPKLSDVLVISACVLSIKWLGWYPDVSLEAKYILSCHAAVEVTKANYFGFTLYFFVLYVTAGLLLCVV